MVVKFESLSNKFKVGDIVVLRYGAFERFPGKKLVTSHHMFVVVDTENVCEISSQSHKVSEKYPWNVEIQDWTQTGLVKPSHVKTDTYGEVDDADVFEKIGELSERDKQRVLHAYQQSPQSYILEWYERG